MIRLCCSRGGDEPWCANLGKFEADNRCLDPVVQNIVSLTISLRHKFVKQISAKVTKNNSVFVILTFEILTKR